jgi:hypothetical protein
MTWPQWLQHNALYILLVLFTFYLVAFNKFPGIASWQTFLDSFESKGGQLVLLWVTDMVVLAVLVHYWEGFSATLQNFMTGLISGVNGAFLGAIGARNTSAGNGTPPGGAPDNLGVSFSPPAGKS